VHADSGLGNDVLRKSYPNIIDIEAFSDKMVLVHSTKKNIDYFFLGFRRINDHFVVSSPLPDMLKFTQKTSE